MVIDAQDQAPTLFSRIGEMTESAGAKLDFEGKLESDIEDQSTAVILGQLSFSSNKDNLLYLIDDPNSPPSLYALTPNKSLATRSTFSILRVDPEDVIKPNKSVGINSGLFIVDQQQVLQSFLDPLTHGPQSDIQVSRKSSLSMDSSFTPFGPLLFRRSQDGSLVSLEDFSD